MLGSAYGRLRNMRTRTNSTTSSDSDGDDFSLNQHVPAPLPSADARQSLDSADMPVSPPPSYDEVVSDDAFVAPNFAHVAHHESYRTRKSRQRTGSRVLSMEYGLRSSKIYMRG